MRKRTHKTWIRRSVPLLVVAIALGAGAWALTASNTFAGNSGGTAGGGSESISGYDVGAPSYTLLGSDANKIASFTFTMDPVTASTTVKAGVVDGTFADDCSVGTITAGSATVTCTYNSGNEPLLTAATDLTVVGTN
jgi:hypothetical protein